MEQDFEHDEDRRGWDGAVAVTVALLPERRLLEPNGGPRYVDCHLMVESVRSGVVRERPSLAVALVLDRSGSMQGEKLVTAKRATLAVLDELDERDRVAVVVFDDKIDVLQRCAPVSVPLKKALAAALGRVEARGTTALRQGWLTGCQQIAGDSPFGAKGAVGRCLLLTDGLANVGITDPEQIATEAAGVRENAGIGTSTFGIGADYNEALLGPLAVAGGGQFHHLRSAAEIANTFLAELAELMEVAAGGVRLEIMAGPGVALELVSSYWSQAAGEGRWSIGIGDLTAGEERHVVIGFTFPPQNGRSEQTVRARAVWTADGRAVETAWQEISFAYAASEACAGEARAPEVMHWLGLHGAERARREASQHSKEGDQQGALAAVQQAMPTLMTVAAGDPEAAVALSELRGLEKEVQRAPMSPLAAKEMFFQAQRVSRGQRDLRAAAVQRAVDMGLLVAPFLRGGVLWRDSLAEPLPDESLRDGYRGSLLWGAVGDALGRAVEGQTPEQIRARYGERGLQHYVPRPGWQSGPTGTITDDTQLTMELARSLIASGGHFDPSDFARRLVTWLPNGRGVGQATREVVERIERGEEWWRASRRVNSAGNGAAMRAAPAGLAWALGASPERLRREAVLSALVTHSHPVGVAGAVAVAAAVAWGIRQRVSCPGVFDVPSFVGFVVEAIAGMEPEQTALRKPRAGRIRLGERLAQLPDLLRLTPDEAFAETWNGAFALESVPAALYCFLRSPDDPQQVIVTAVSGGRDADTVAAMAGNVAGAWIGAEHLKSVAPEWWRELEYRDELIDLADDLLRIARGGGGSEGTA